MKERNLRLRVAAMTLAGVGTIGSLGLAPADLQAGVFRDVYESIVHSKPPPPKPGQGLPRHGYACCNLHYSRNAINDGNYAELPMISVGTPIDVVSYGRNFAYVTIDGRQMHLNHDYGRDQESLEAWVGKIVVDADPKPHIAAYRKAVRDAIYEGKLVVGMTRQQAIESVGYPLTSENMSTEQPTWRMWRSTHGEYQLNFRADGKLGSVTGDDSVTSLVVYHPTQQEADSGGSRR